MIKEIKEDTDFANINLLFFELNKLMQDPLFIEALFHKGFKYRDPDPIPEELKKTLYQDRVCDIPGATPVWDFASSIAPLLCCFIAFKEAESQANPEYRVMYNEELLGCREREWQSPIPIHEELSSALKGYGPNNDYFFGSFDFDMRSTQDQREYEDLIKQIKAPTFERSSALVRICDGIFTECLFFIKDGDRLEVLLATGHSVNRPSHVHHKTEKLIKKYNIKKTTCSKITVIHDGNCTLHSTLNINTVLQLATLLPNASVYTVLDKLRKNRLNLNDFRIQYEDSPKVDEKFKPDGPTYVRLLFAVGVLAKNIGLETQWSDFCKKRSIIFPAGIKIHSTTLKGDIKSHDTKKIVKEKNDIFPLELNQDNDARLLEKKLAQLKIKVKNAVESYCDHSEAICFSIFHRHGVSGRLRARKFKKSIFEVQNYTEACEMIIQFLKDNKNGNTYPHSFRTMLGSELLENKNELKLVSKSYKKELKKVESTLFGFKEPSLFDRVNKTRR
ncbi:hypothetical protein [Fluoribacter gormanii]|uniref:hypothetical protein n=1 Tax=Fluoribacter gormanii TaxID=464 RepID=UPI001040FDB3|nr:hypothetical protein [Fluoribacter gormanii]